MTNEVAVAVWKFHFCFFLSFLLDAFRLFCSLSPTLWEKVLVWFLKANANPILGFPLSIRVYVFCSSARDIFSWCLLPVGFPLFSIIYLYVLF